jgi:hypothetical protein
MVISAEVQPFPAARFRKARYAFQAWPVPLIA